MSWAQELWIAAKLPLPAAARQALAVGCTGSMWQTVLGLLTSAWAAAFLAVVCGHRRAAAAFALVALVPVSPFTDRRRCDAGLGWSHWRSARSLRIDPGRAGEASRGGAPADR